MSTGAALLSRTEAGEYVYDVSEAGEPQFVTAEAIPQPERSLAEGWRHPDVVDELLSELRSLGRRAEAEQIEATLRDFDALHDGPIILDSAASARLDEIMSSHSGPLPEPPLSLDAFPSE